MSSPDLDLEPSPVAREVAGKLRHPDPSQLWFQIHEIIDERVYLRHGITLAEDDVVLDVGANVGVAAAFFAHVCRAGAVHSFEPVQPIFELLRENLRQFPACTAHPYGLSSEPGEAEITYYPGASAMSGLYADPYVDRRLVHDRLRKNLGLTEDEATERLHGTYVPTRMSCELRTLSGVLDELSLQQVDLLKIDVEKSESDVIEGIEARDWARVRQVAMEVHDQDRGAAVARRLDENGFLVKLEQDATMQGTEVQMLYALRR